MVRERWEGRWLCDGLVGRGRACVGGAVQRGVEKLRERKDPNEADSSSHKGRRKRADRPATCCSLRYTHSTRYAIMPMGMKKTINQPASSSDESLNNSALDALSATALDQAAALSSESRGSDAPAWAASSPLGDGFSAAEDPSDTADEPAGESGARPQDTEAGGGGAVEEEEDDCPPTPPQKKGQTQTLGADDEDEEMLDQEMTPKPPRARGGARRRGRRRRRRVARQRRRALLRGRRLRRGD